ncbi:peptidase, S1A subfamily [Trichuris trichiura]|uniref:Peptidase, S1A subfamily n=1 Tax=Trichuris trichiura TaxID=36087 RepID=A0A077Z596_TRITR|nr:peptidase, S1A subfamily [Trichuris trichiura]
MRSVDNVHTSKILNQRKHRKNHPAMLKILLTVVAVAVHQCTSARISEPYDDGVCGRSSFQIKANIKRNRITGGHEANPHSHPWIVFIQYGEQKCGGVILPTADKNSSNVLLTAAHCLKHLLTAVMPTKPLVTLITKEDLKNGTVIAGAHDLGRLDEEGRQNGKVKQVILADGGAKNDIALIILENSFVFNDYVKSPCLSQNNYLPPRTKCLVSGWGAIEGGVYRQISKLQNVSLTHLTHVPPLQMPTRLMESGVKRHSDYFCEYAMGPAFDYEVHICAGQEKGRKGVNNHDSGGPLICYDHNLWTLYGITKGRTFVHPSRPSLFMKIASYAQFIRGRTGIEWWPY